MGEKKKIKFKCFVKIPLLYSALCAGTIFNGCVPMAPYYGHYGNDPILLFFPVVVVSDWEAVSSCSLPASQPACLPGNIVKAHQRPLPWLNAVPSPRRSAGKDAKFRDELVKRHAVYNDVRQRWSAAPGPLLGEGTL